MTGVSHAIAVVVIALAGVAGFSALGGAMRSAIASSSTDAPAREAGSPALSRQAGAIEDVARGAVELYRDIPLELELKASRWDDSLVPHVRALDEQRLSAAEFGQRLGVRGGEARLLHGLYREFFRLRDAGLFEKGEYRMGVTGPTQTTLSALGVVAFQPFAQMPHVINWLERARLSFEAADLPFPEEFFERIKSASRIYRGGIDETTRANVFGGARMERGFLTPELLSRYESPRMTAVEFALKYDANPTAALDLVPDAGRAYLQAEILPFFADDLVGREAPGALLGAIVTGDQAKLANLLTMNGAEDLPADTLEALRFAASMFAKPQSADVRPFTPAEAEALVHYPLTDVDLDSLRARENGGEPLADLAKIFADADFKRLPGRSGLHESQAVEGVLRAIASGDATAFEQHAIVLSDVIQEVPRNLSSSMRELLEHFERGVAPTEGPTP